MRGNILLSITTLSQNQKSKLCFKWCLPLERVRPLCLTRKPPSQSTYHRPPTYLVLSILKTKLSCTSMHLLSTLSPCQSVGVFHLTEQFASTKLEAENMCKASYFTNLLTVVSTLSLLKDDENQSVYPRFIYTSQQLYNGGLAAFGFQRDGNVWASPDISRNVAEALRIIKISVFKRICPYTDQASTFHASGSSIVDSASSKAADPGSAEAIIANGIGNTSTGTSITIPNSSSDRTS